MKLSIIIPTLGRDTLKRAVDSVLESAGEDDEVLVIADGPDAYDRSKKVLYDYHARSNTDYRVDLTCTEKTTDWAATQLEEGMKAARGDYIANIGDDDYMTPNACNTIKQSIEEWLEAGGEPTVHLFAVKLEHWMTTLWGEVRWTKVTGQQWVIPTTGPRGVHDSEYGNDFRFLRDTLEKRGIAHPVYHNHVISVLPKHGKGKL